MRSRRNFAVAAALLATVSLAPAIKADATADARKAIQSNYIKADSAMAHKDVNAVMALHSPDYVSVSKKGKTTSLADLKTSFSKLIPAAKTIKSTTVVQKLVLKGKEAVATIKEHAEILLVNPQQPSQTAKIVADATSEDTWVQGAKGWLIKKSKTLTSKQTANGQEIPDQG